MKRAFFFLTTVMEVCALLYLGNILYHRLILKERVLGATTAAPIPKDAVTVYKIPELKYYFEFNPGQNVAVPYPWSPKTITYTINDDTLNDRNNYSVEKPEDTYRIITLGDSFTFGQYVNTADSWPKRLEDDLNNDSACSGKKFEVLNLGMPFYGVEYIAHRYETRGLKYNPDLILWLESGTGFTRVNELLMQLVDKYREEIPQKKVDEALAKGEYIVEESAEKEMYKSHPDNELHALVKNSWDSFFTTRGETSVVIATFKSILPSQLALLQDWTTGKVNVRLFNGIDDANVGKMYLKDGHPSIYGHEMIASSIQNYLKSASLVPCTENSPNN